MSLAGIILSLIEMKKDKKISIVGLFGHISLILCFLTILIYRF